MSLAFNYCISVNSEELKPRMPSGLVDTEDNIPTYIDLKKIPSFPIKLKNSGLQNPALLINSRLRLSLDSPIDTKKSKVGDYFKAKVLEDFYLPMQPPQIIIPKGSWLRGRISYIKRPNFLNKTGKFNLHIHQLITPLSEAAVLDAEIYIEKGIVNSEGLMDPVSLNENEQLALQLGMQEKSVSVNESSKIIDSLFTGSLVGLHLDGDTNILNKGQELQILLKKNLQLTN